MSSPIATIADAVATALNGAGTFALPFSAVRIYRPEFNLEDMGTLHVTVIPGNVVRRQIARRLVERLYSVGVLVQRKVTAETNEEIDPLIEVADQIAEYIGPGELANSGGAEWVETEHEPIYDPDHMKEMKLFTNPVIFTFRL